MNCIDFTKLRRDFLTSDEAAHLKGCCTCRLEWQQYMAVLDEPLEDILEDIRRSEERYPYAAEQPSSIDTIVSIMEQAMPEGTPLLTVLKKIAEKAAVLLPQAPPEQIASCLMAFDEKDIQDRSEEAVLDKLKREIDEDAGSG